MLVQHTRRNMSMGGVGWKEGRMLVADLQPTIELFVGCVHKHITLASHLTDIGWNLLLVMRCHSSRRPDASASTAV